MNQTRLHILLVEDAPDMREVLGTLFELHGLHVAAAASAAEAIEIARQPGPIDILVADLQLPDGDGREVADDVSRLRPGVRCLFLSGGQAPPALGPGQAFLRKPAAMADILGQIGALLAQPIGRHARRGAGGKVHS